jgi:hypothetical protein
VRCGLGRSADPSSAALADQRDPVTGQPLPSFPGAPSSPPSRPVWQRLLRFWWVGAIVVVVAVGWFTTARRGGNGEINDSGTLSVADLQVGDCFNNTASTEVSQVDAVPCAEPHQYELFHVFRISGTIYPTTADLDTQSASACAPAFAAYVGHDYETSTLYISTLYPTSDGWGHGAREVQCVVHNDAESKVTGSVRGTAR